ncbi:MAG: hypothetical protein WAT12_04335 [Candidatus Nitrotoga sp.]
MCANARFVTASLYVVSNEPTSHGCGGITAAARDLTGSLVLQGDRWSCTSDQSRTEKTDKGVGLAHGINRPVEIVGMDWQF